MMFRTGKQEQEKPEIREGEFAPFLEEKDGARQGGNQDRQATQTVTLVCSSYITLSWKGKIMFIRYRTAR